MAAAATAAIASATPSCSNSEEGPIPIPPVATDGGTTTDGGAGGDGGMGGDGGGCVPNPKPACFNTDPYVVELPAGSYVSVGDLTVRMLSAHEDGSGVEVAEFEILDSCGNRIRLESIMEGETKVYTVDGTNLRITITALEVSITNPKAKLSVDVDCLDGGVTDGGTGGGDGGSGGDGGTGGMDSGTGGMDSGTGGMDSGTGGDGGSGGMDSGTGGMDGGVTDGGTTDSGTGGDGGMGGMDSGTGGDGGMGGMDGGVTDGGTTDSGTGGDGGMTDGGTTDGGPTGLSCSGLGTGSQSAIVLTGNSMAVGGYSFTYLGPNSEQVMLDIGCAEGVVYNNILVPEDVMTSLIDLVNGRKINITPHGFNSSQVNWTVAVVNYP